MTVPNGSKIDCIYSYSEDGELMCECDHDVCDGSCPVRESRKELKKAHVQIKSLRPPTAEVYVNGEKLQGVYRAEFEHEAGALPRVVLYMYNCQIDIDEYADVEIRDGYTD